MKINYKDIIKKVEFFDDKIDSIQMIEAISENKIKISTNEEIYVLGLYSMNDYSDIEIELNVNKYLKNIGLEPLLIYYSGIMPDINKAYKVFQFREETSLGNYLMSADKAIEKKIGFEFGKILKRVHEINLNVKRTDWNSLVETKVNFLLYRHGLNDLKDERDYIFIDHLRENMYLTKNTGNDLLYSKFSTKNIRIYDNSKIDVRGLKRISYGDGVSDFIELNRIAIKHPDFSKACIAGYHNNRTIPRKFFRLLSLYQSYAILKSLVDIREGVKPYLNEIEIEQIINMYDEFSTIKPKWA